MSDVPTVIFKAQSALKLADGLPFKDWLAIGRDLAKAERSLNWLIGEWWAFGKQTYRERLQATNEAWWKDQRLPTFGSCATYAKVFRVFETCRNLQVSIDHHNEVTAIARDNMQLAQELLRRAAEEKLSALELRAEVRKIRAAERTGELVEMPLPTDAPVHILYADPPWQYENPPMGGGNRSIENHYPTMTIDELKALDVSSCALENALLFMWATAPKLSECLELLEPWGFTYRTNLVWDKIDIGMGYYGRNQHELLLICKRGEIPPPPPDLRVPSLYSEPRTAHSRKPIYYYELIESWYSTLRKRELFSRAPARPGWEEPWGNEFQILEAAE